MTKIAQGALLCAGLLFSLGSCTSPDKEGAAMTGDAHTIECTCGQPEAMLEGCAHPKCAAGENNPDNPDCVCGSLSFEEDKQ